MGCGGGGGRESDGGGKGSSMALESKGGRGSGGRESLNGEGERRSAEGITMLGGRENEEGGESFSREAGNSSPPGTEERAGNLEGDDFLT